MISYTVSTWQHGWSRPIKDYADFDVFDMQKLMKMVQEDANVEVVFHSSVPGEISSFHEFLSAFLPQNLFLSSVEEEWRDFKAGFEGGSFLMVNRNLYKDMF